MGTIWGSTGLVSFPEWPASELTHLPVSLVRALHEGETRTGIQFLFTFPRSLNLEVLYDPQFQNMQNNNNYNKLLSFISIQKKFVSQTQKTKLLDFDYMQYLEHANS